MSEIHKVAIVGNLFAKGREKLLKDVRAAGFAVLPVTESPNRGISLVNIEDGNIGQLLQAIYGAKVLTRNERRNFKKMKWR